MDPALQQLTAGSVVLDNVDNTQSEGLRHHSVATGNGSVQDTYNSPDDDKENVAPQGTTKPINAKYKMLFENDGDYRVVHLRLYQDFLLEYMKGPPRVYGPQESASHRFIIWNALEYIREHQGKLCRYTPKGESSISKGEGSFSKYVTGSPPTVYIKLNLPEGQLLKATEEIKVLKVQMESLKGENESFTGRLKQVEGSSTKRSRDDVSEPASTRYDIPETTPELETEEPASKRIRREDE